MSSVKFEEPTHYPCVLKLTLIGLDKKMVDSCPANAPCPIDYHDRLLYRTISQQFNSRKEFLTEMINIRTKSAPSFRTADNRYGLFFEVLAHDDEPRPGSVMETLLYCWAVGEKYMNWTVEAYQKIKVKCISQIEIVYGTREYVRELIQGEVRVESGGCLSVRCDGCEVANPECDMFECSGCETIAYCSEICQRKMWPDHKKWCRGVQRSKAELAKKERAERAELAKNRPTSCAVPCEPRIMIGKSWWKSFGYESACGCAERARYSKEVEGIEEVW